VAHEKSIAAVLAETKQELQEFIETRINILKSEIKEKLKTWKWAVPLLLLSLSILLAAWITITIGLVAAVHVWFLPSAYSWCLAGVIVGALYLVIGVSLFFFSWGKLKEAGVAPVHTLEVLKEDQIWIRKETRAA
jgi:hypothetical protein